MFAASASSMTPLLSSTRVARSMLDVSYRRSQVFVGGSIRNHSSKTSTRSSTTAAGAGAAKQGTTSATTAAATAQTATTAKFSWSSIPKNHPFAFQLGIATVKTSAADLMAQIGVERKSWDEIDWRRNAIFIVFGFSYLGVFQWWLMVTKYRQWFPTMDRFAKLSFADKLKDKAGILDALKMVLFDVTIHLPVMYFPTYYTVKEFVGGSSWSPIDWAKDGLTKYANNAKEDLTAMIQLWGPSDCVQFVLPVHIRLPFRHFVSFFWTAYVSFTRGAIEEKEEPVTTETTTTTTLSKNTE